MRYLLIILSLVLINPFLLAVGEAGAIFLLISPSPTINGFGGAGTSVPTTDIYSSYYNPAQPQLPSGLSIQYSNSKTNWLKTLVPGIVYNYNVNMIGYKSSILNDYNFQTSITRSEIFLDLGEQYIYYEAGDSFNTFRPYFSSEALTFSFGVGSNSLPIFFGLGATTKKVKQDLGYIPESSPSDVISENVFHDWGLRFSLYDYQIKNNKNIRLNYSLGYSKSNIGDRIYFSDNPTESDPAPTTSRLGMTFGGTFIMFDNFTIDLKLIREAEELMLKNGYIDNIDIVKHIFQGEADKDIVIHKGSEITVNNFLSLRTGQYIDLDGDIECKTMGIGMNFGESIKFVPNAFFDSSEIKLLDYFNLKYNFSYYSLEKGHPLSNTTFNELTLSVKNIDNIF